VNEIGAKFCEICGEKIVEIQPIIKKNTGNLSLNSFFGKTFSFFHFF
jgi:hypothetical protein